MNKGTLGSRKREKSSSHEGEGVVSERHTDSENREAQKHTACKQKPGSSRGRQESMAPLFSRRLAMYPQQRARNRTHDG